MEFSTNHDKSEYHADFAFRLHEETENEINSAEIAVRINEFIDSRTELDLEIRKRALAFMKRAVSQLEEELKGK